MSIFLDSGAFSAWQQNDPIDIHKYIDFIKKHEKYIDIYANLDIIGSSKFPGKETAELTLKNQRIMEKAGLTPIPCFHVGEPLDYLHYYVEDYNYIALGGMAKMTKNKRKPVMDNYFSSFICDKEGMPKCKVHGFGMTDFELMLRYPWYSVDSMSWISSTMFGSIFVPTKVGDKWDFTKPVKVSVSTRSKSRDHFDSVPKLRQTHIIQYLNERGYVIGKSEFKQVSDGYVLKENEHKIPGGNTIEIIVEPGVSNNRQQRLEINAYFYKSLQDSVPKWPWPFINLKMRFSDENLFCG